MKLVKNYQDFVNETYEASLAEPTVDLQFSLLTLELLAVRDQAHLFHWQTKSYEEHIAFGDFYDDFIDKVDVLWRILWLNKIDHNSLRDLSH